MKIAPAIIHCQPPAFPLPNNSSQSAFLTGARCEGEQMPRDTRRERDKARRRTIQYVDELIFHVQYCACSGVISVIVYSETVINPKINPGV